MPAALDRLLPHLLTIHARGALVPFLGAGMSRDACPDWATMVERLEAIAGTRTDDPAEKEHRTDPATRLIRRADRAVEALRRRGGESPDAALAQALRQALYREGPGEIPAQTVALAQLWWPLVLTTNYDSLYLRACQAYDEAHRTLRPHEPRHTPTVLGRTARDIQRLLGSLDGAPDATLWTLQGYLPAGSTTGDSGAAGCPGAEAPGELVVGHAEYRRAAHTQPRFRRAFAEVFRRRSFLFLGTGLAEPYFLELFDEVLEYFGPSPEPHFAFARRGDLDGRFLRSRYNIQLLEYEEHEDLVDWLDRLGRDATQGRHTPVTWGWRWDPPNELFAGPDLEICRGPVSAGCIDFAGGALAVGARPGRPGHAVVPEAFREIGTALGAHFGDEVPLPPPGPRGIHRLLPHTQGSETPLVALLAAEQRLPGALRSIADGVAEALDWAREAGHAHLRMPLLRPANGIRLPPFFALVEMIRGYRAWRATHPDRVRLTLHLVGEEAIHVVASGRIDVAELLAAHELRFWAEVEEEPERTSRELCFATPETTLADLAARLAVQGPGWQVEALPSPGPAENLPGGEDSRTLLDLGVVPGGTVRFRRTATPPRA
jgi:hypothetical protein